MHPPSPIIASDRDGHTQKVLHIIQDIRNLKLEDNEDQLLESALSWANFCNLTERHRLSVKTDTNDGPTEVGSLHPAMARLALNEATSTEGDSLMEEAQLGEPFSFQTSGSYEDNPFSTAFMDDLHILFPPPTIMSPTTDNLTLGSPQPQGSHSQLSSSPTPSSAKRQRRRRRRIAPSSRTSAIPSLDHTRKQYFSKSCQRKPFYQAIRPPSIASFLRPSIARGHLASPSFPHHSRDPPDPVNRMAGYPQYVTELAKELGEGDNVYPLWYILLAFWFPEQEGFEVVNHWTPRIPGNEGPGSEVRVFAPIEATLAVLWLGSPVCVVQIAPSQSSGMESHRTEMMRAAERLFDDAALYSELPTLCVLEVLSKQFWGGFVRSTDSMPNGQLLQDCDWFGPGWEKDAGTHSEGQSVTSCIAFELLGRCFAALKANCMGVS